MLARDIMDTRFHTLKPHETVAQAVNMFQTYSQALRMILPTSWGMIRAGGVAALSGVSW